MSASERVLQVVPTRQRVAELLRLRLGEHGAALGLGLIDIRTLEDRLVRATEMRVAGASEARLAIASVASDAARGTMLAELASRPGFPAAFLELWDGLRRAGIDLADFVRLADRLGGSSSGRRFTALGAIASAYEGQLAARGLVDEAGAHQGLPDALRRIDRTRVTDLLDGAGVLKVESSGSMTVLAARLLQALVDLGVGVRVVVPEIPARVAAAELGEALEFARRNLIDAAPGVELITQTIGHAGLLAFAAAQPTAGERVRPRVRLIEADDLRAELRAVTAAIRELLHSGVGAHRITIAVPRLHLHRRPLIAALDGAGIRWEERRPRFSAGDAGPTRLALALLDAAERELPRDRLAAILESAYVAVPGGADLIEALRDAGSRDDRGSGHVARLREFAARLARSGPKMADRSARLLALADAWQSSLAQLRLAPRATLADHFAGLHAAITGLGIPARCHQVPEPQPTERSFERASWAAAARDRHALDMLDRVRVVSVDAALALGIAERSMELAEFRAHLEYAIDRLPAPVPDARGTGVGLCDLAEFTGATTDHLFVIHAIDGELPGPGRSLPFLDEDDRLALDRAAGRRVLFPPGAADAVAFGLACAGARESVAISCHREDGQARERQLSRWFVAIRDHAGVPAERWPSTVVAPLDACSTRGQVVTRRVHRARARGELDSADRQRPALAPALAWLDRHSDELGRPRIHLDVDALALAHAQLGFDVGAERIWRGSATALEHYASCPFRSFSDRVLRVRAPTPSGDELDPSEQGRLRHEVMFEVMVRLRAAGLTPLRGGEATPAENAHALAAGERVLDRWAAHERTGPRALWLLHRDLVLRDLLRVLEGERRAAVETWEPTEFERGFGPPEGEPLAIPSRDGRQRFELVGRVDRIDSRGAGRELEALIVDYKSGRVGDRLRYTDLARTQLQLPLYAAWLASERTDLTHTDAVYVSLSDGERSRVSMLDLILSSVDLDGLLDLDPARRAELRARAGSAPSPELSSRSGSRPELPSRSGSRPESAGGALDLPVTGQRNLADNVWALLGGLAEGRFDVRPVDPPRTCALCPYSIVCRIERGGVGP